MGIGGDPTSGGGGLSSLLGGLDPSAIGGGLGGLGDLTGGLGTGGLGGGLGTTTTSPGGDIAQSLNAQGDPTGATAAATNLQAGTPSPGVPGGGIGGAQSNAGIAPQAPPQAPPQTQTPQDVINQRYPSGSVTPGEQINPAQTSTIPKTTGPGSAGFDPTASTPSSFDSRFPSGPGLPQPGQQATQLAQKGIDFPESGMAPGGGPGAAAAPTTESTQQAGPAAPPATTDKTADTGAGAGTTPSAGAGTPRAGAGQGAGAFPAGAGTGTTPGGGAAGGLPGGLGGINPINIISALLRGGPMGALSELAREAQGQGMMGPGGQGGPQGQGGGFRSRYPGDTGPEPETSAATSPETPAAAAPNTSTSPGALATATDPNQAAPAGTATAAAPTTEATQGANLGAGNIPAGSLGPAQPPTAVGQNQAADRWVNQGHVGLSRNAGSDTQPTPGYSSTMRQARAPAFEGMTPHLRQMLYGMMQAENETDPIGPMESLANRATSNNTTIGHMLSPHFYGPFNSFQRRGAAIMRNPAARARYDSAIAAVQAGSNVLGGATDQGSGRDPNVGYRGGRIHRSGETYNDWGGGRGHAANGAWRRQIQARVRSENAATGNPPRPPAPIPQAPQGRMPLNIRLRDSMGNPLGAGIENVPFPAPGSMGRGTLDPGWRPSTNVEDVSGEQPLSATLQRNADASLARMRDTPGYFLDPMSEQRPMASSALARSLGVGDISLDQITQLLGQLQQSPQ
jgi:hypothetical protein